MFHEWNMNVNERIRKIREILCNNSNKEFAIKIGVAPNVANNYIRNGYSVGEGVLYKILEKIPEINKSWLFTGEGEMLKSNINISGDINVNNKSGKISGDITTGTHINNDNGKEVEFLKKLIDEKDSQLQLKDKIIQLLEIQLEKNKKT
jgi:hypothetical protein